MEEKEEESEFIARNFLGVVDEEMFEVLESKGDVGSSNVGSSFYSFFRVLGFRLGEDMEAYVLRLALRGYTV